MAPSWWRCARAALETRAAPEAARTLTSTTLRADQVFWLRLATAAASRASYCSVVSYSPLTAGPWTRARSNRQSRPASPLCRRARHMQIALRGSLTFAGAVAPRARERYGQLLHQMGPCRQNQMARRRSTQHIRRNWRAKAMAMYDNIRPLTSSSRLPCHLQSGRGEVAGVAVANRCECGGARGTIGVGDSGRVQYRLSRTLVSLVARPTRLPRATGSLGHNPGRSLHSTLQHRCSTMSPRTPPRPNASLAPRSSTSSAQPMPRMTLTSPDSMMTRPCWIRS